ncbi:MAG: hypothetical protein Fur0032_03090 [Terrimicrobiaceae bacterium]
MNRLLILLIFSLTGAGCAVLTYAPEMAPEKVTIVDSPFYRFGPMQPRPDDFLPTGIRMRILRQEMGFSLALLDDGRTGYVANETLAAALPRPKPSATPKRSATRNRVPVLFDATLPEPDPPTPDLEAGPAEIIPEVDVNPGSGLKED